MKKFEIIFDEWQGPTGSGGGVISFHYALNFDKEDMINILFAVSLHPVPPAPVSE